MNKILIAILFIAFALPLSAQELNGIWKGTMTQKGGGCFPVYHLELHIRIQGDKVSGINYHYSDVKNYVKKRFAGVYYPSIKSINISEGNVLTFHIPDDCSPCVKNYELRYKKAGNKETLSGEWTGVVLNGAGACPPGNIVLERITKSEFDHIKEVAVDTGVLKLEFYDNGIIDGDSISVVVNNVTVVSNQMLSLKPITIEVKIDENNPVQEITMVAENLGSIPPNTALLIITAGKFKHHLQLESTDKKSAQVRLVWKESANY